MVDNKISMPLGLGYDRKHDLLGVTDIARKTALVYQLPEGEHKLTIGGRNGILKNPTDIAFDPDRERIYVSDSKANTVHVFDFEGNKIMNIGGPGNLPGYLFSPTQLTVAEDGLIYIVETFNFRFQVFDPEGNSVAVVGKHGSMPGMFARPKGIAVDSEDHAYITDAAFGNFQVMDK
ncbi:MAG: hypothetical protein GWN77_03315, partial [Gammaproteobacteria bacterium]|nr:hypothetical protein [Gammaproteobacteria bacterium]